MLNDSNYQNLIGISEEIGIGNIKSDRFNCDLYEKHLRDLRRIADLIGEEDVKQEIDWFFLLPFDVANCNPVLAEERNLGELGRKPTRPVELGRGLICPTI